MTIDEAIENLKEDYEIDMYIRGIAPQLAEWLEELKMLRELKDEHRKIGNIEGYNKAIDDFAKWLENKKYLMKEIQEHDYCYTHYDELKANCVTTEYFAEQLKAGGTDA